MTEVTPECATPADGERQWNFFFFFNDTRTDSGSYASTVSLKHVTLQPSSLQASSEVKKNKDILTANLCIFCL